MTSIAQPVSGLNVSLVHFGKKDVLDSIFNKKSPEIHKPRDIDEMLLVGFRAHMEICFTKN